jgi:hypothetical protein
MRAFVPYYDVVGVETSFEQVPLVNQFARPYYGSGHHCAVLAGLEAYFYQPLDMLRWRGYRSVYEGCSGVGLCPSEMLRARPEILTYLRGLDGEFRGMETILTDAQPPQPVSCSPASEVQVFERLSGGHRYIFVLRAPGKSGSCKVDLAVGSGVPAPESARVRFEGRSLPITGGHFSDTLAGPYSVHVYQL